MSNYEGNYVINIDTTNLSDEEQSNLESIIDTWRDEHPLDNDVDWVRTIKYPAFESISYSGNTDENIEDIQEFMNHIAKTYPKLNASGRGYCVDAVTGSWDYNYSFELNNGQLEWVDDDYSEGNDPIEGDFVRRNGPYENNKKSLGDIFPELNETFVNYMTISEGICSDIDYSGYLDAIGDGQLSFYFPPEVKGMDHDTNMFNMPGTILDNLVITTNMDLYPLLFMCRGFRNFYVIDPDTKNVVFKTNKFICANDLMFIGLIDEFEWFCDDFNEDHQQAFEKFEEEEAEEWF